jgi:hypothetical protein
MGTKFFGVVYDKHGIGGGGECCGDSDAQLGRINVFYPEASGGKYMPCAVFFDLEPGVKQLDQRPITTKGLGANSAEPPCSVAAFVVNSRVPHRGSLSVRV